MSSSLFPMASQPFPPQAAAAAMSRTITTGDGTAVLAVLLAHDPLFLLVRDLGVLSMCNKTLQQQSQLAWKLVWEAMMAQPDYAMHDLMERTFLSRMVFHARNSKDSWASCFTNPTRAAVVGYKNAVACLYSKLCKYCGQKSFLAHPFTWERICHLCAKANRNHWLMVPKQNAKEAFLLCKQDMERIPTIVIPSSGRQVTVCRVVDVIKASWTKHGGLYGLQTAIDNKKAKAMEKYKKSLLTNNPQKSLPKVCELVNRPTEHLESFPNTFTVLFVGERDGPNMMHGYKCSVCGWQGYARDVEMHILLNHGRDEGMPVYEPRANDVSSSQPIPLRLSRNKAAWAALSVPQALKSRIMGTTTTLSGIRRASDTRGDSFRKWQSNRYYVTSGPNIPVTKVYVDWDEWDGTEWSVGSVSIKAQVCENPVPMELLLICTGKNSKVNAVGSGEQFERIFAAWGFATPRSTVRAGNIVISPAQLLATLLLDSIDIDESTYAFLHCDTSHPIVQELQGLLKAATDRNE